MTTISTFTIPPIEPIRAITIVFIPELCDNNLSGLKVLSNLRILIIGTLMDSKEASITDVTTMKKSN